MTPNDWADFWYYEIGLNVFPAISKNKLPIIKWTNDKKGNWQKESIPESMFKEWKKQNKFKDGLGAVCGKSFRGIFVGLWYNVLDCDNNYGIDSLTKDIKKLAEHTLVEQHDNKNKAHISYFTERPIKSKAPNDDLDSKGKALPQIEIKSGGNLLIYPAGNVHKDGSLVDIIGIKKPQILKAEQLEKTIEKIYSKTDISYLNGKSNLKIGKRKNLQIQKEGGRNNNFFIDMKEYYKLNPDLEEGLKFGLQLNQINNKPPMSERECKDTIISAWNDVNKNKKENKPFKNDDWKTVAYQIQDESHFVTVRETGDMWIYSDSERVYIPNADTYVNEKSENFIYKCNTKSRNEIKNTIKSNGTMILARNFFDSTVINTHNCVIDPNTFEELPQSYKDLTTTKLPFAVNSKAKNYKLWIHIVRNIIQPKDRRLFLEILWVIISWKNPHKKCIIFLGLSDTQKTTLMEIIAWIVGSENISTEKPQKFLVSGDKFTMSKFIGKRVNFSDEINNLTPDMLENLKAMIGGISQSAEYKNKNEGRIFDPKRFLFIFGTNYLDSIYQKVDDNSTINRFQFMKFNHVIKKKKGDWENEFFKDDEDKQSAIETIINLMLFWKRSKQIFDFDEAWKTKEILRAEIPVEDKYFESGRIIVKRGAKLFLDDIKRDFETYCSVPVSNQTLGYLLKDKGYVTKKSGGKMYIQGFTLSESSSNERID